MIHMWVSLSAQSWVIDAYTYFISWSSWRRRKIKTHCPFAYQVTQGIIRTKPTLDIAETRLMTFSKWNNNSHIRKWLKTSQTDWEVPSFERTRKHILTVIIPLRDDPLLTCRSRDRLLEHSVFQTVAPMHTAGVACHELGLQRLIGNNRLID